MPSRRINITKTCAPLIARLQEQPAALRIKTAFDMGNQLQDVMAEVGATRRAAVRELRADGWTLEHIAKEANISVSRVKQIQDGTPSRRRKQYVPVGRMPQSDTGPTADEREAV